MMSEGRKVAWDRVLFCARRLCSPQADNHPEWRVAYLAAKAQLAEIQEKERTKAVIKAV